MLAPLVETANAPGNDSLDCVMADTAILGQIRGDLEQVQPAPRITIGSLGNEIEIGVIDREFMRSEPPHTVIKSSPQ